MGTWTPPSRSSTPSESLLPTSPTSCPRSSAGSCPRTRRSTVSRGCSPTPAWTPSRELLTTCPSPRHCMESPTCRHSPLGCLGKTPAKAAVEPVWADISKYQEIPRCPEISNQDVLERDIQSLKRLVLLCSV